MQLLAVIYRNENDSAKANAIIKTILSYDPLNHFAGFEKYLWQINDENKNHFINLIRNELPQETFFELGIGIIILVALMNLKKYFHYLHHRRKPRTGWLSCKINKLIFL